MPTRATNPLRLIQRLIAVTALALTIFVAIRLSFIQAVLRRVTIDGPSMAPHLLGSHFNVTCADCKFIFSCDAEHLPTDNLAACPNCGYTANRLDQAQLLPADRVLIDRWPLLWSAPKRGSVVAISLPGTNDLAVKRIAALPGERLSIQDGDLFANGQLIRKTTAELTSLRQLVHDNAFQPQQTTDLPARWRPLTEFTSWQATPSGFRAAPANSDDTIDWLQYENWKCTADSPTRGIASYITDNDSYNQGETHRSLNAVPDVLISCRIRTVGEGKFTLAAVDMHQRFELEIEPRKSAVLRTGEQTLVDRKLTTNFPLHFAQVDFGLCDQEVFLMIDGRTIFRHPYNGISGDFRQRHPLAIGTRGLHLEITDLRVWRDVYYLDPQGLDRRWDLPTQLGDHEYALLGDNQPVSIDSRHWQPASIPHSAILGHVYRPFWAIRRLD